jgi:hypothetical protein
LNQAVAANLRAAGLALDVGNGSLSQPAGALDWGRAVTGPLLAPCGKLESTGGQAAPLPATTSVGLAAEKQGVQEQAAKQAPVAKTAIRGQDTAAHMEEAVPKVKKKQQEGKRLPTEAGGEGTAGGSGLAKELKAAKLKKKRKKKDEEEEKEEEEEHNKQKHTDRAASGQDESRDGSVVRSTAARQPAKKQKLAAPEGRIDANSGGPV